MLVGRKEKARPTFSQLDGDPPPVSSDKSERENRQGDAAPPTLPLVCDLPHSYSDRPCGQTFSSEDGLRVHADRWPLDLHS